ncbi:C-myc promoter-binding protein [Geodia barretti]|uniref:C-myc promoter-binding protein n=1 Tax=Geodia barretti TaxID=519541 RepID=A0AA35TFF7_GEOBA|nr:C-myc promoter-binding protein [Geodia barretti]
MEGGPERLADYFLVVGLGQNVSRFEPLPSTEDVDLQTAAADPITDIAVVFKKYETSPKGYHCIEKTPGGHTANLNSGALFGGAIHLAYCRGRDKAPITEISVFYTSSKQPHPPPLGHETVAFSVGGRPADLNKGGTPTYITIKRGILYGHNTAITELCLIMPGKGEEVPAGYKQLQVDLNKGLVTPAVFLCYQTSQVHPPSISFTPEIISRFPERDYADFLLPESVPLFCLPSGVSVEHWDRRASFPLPSFSTFALTNERGICMYGAVVAFYEQMSETEIREDMRESLNVSPEAVLHVTKCICLLSHWPFFSSFRAFLSSLYRLSVSRNTIPLERYIGNLMLDAPFPTMERPRVQLFIGCEQIVFSLPVQTPLPLSVFTHWSLLATLDPPTLLSLHSLLILEQKMVLTSARPALLTSIGEALRSVLFPFSWQCTYIPMCPLAFSNYMQAPVPFIIGVDSQYFNVFEKPSDVCVVDLDTSTITLSNEARSLLTQKPLPSKPLRTLKQDLKMLAAEVADLNPGIGFAVEVTPIESDLSYKTDLV